MSETNNKIDGSSGIGATLVNNVAGNVSSFISTKQTAKYASGARTIIRINGKIAAFATSVSWNIQTTVSEIRTIDDFVPAELAPKHVIVNGTISGLHIPGQGASAEQIQPTLQTFLRQKYVNIEVRDSATDAQLFFTNQALITNRSEVLQSQRLGQVTLQFQAIGWWYEAKTVTIFDPWSLPGLGSFRAWAGI
jgi:hypothetical protein